MYIGVGKKSEKKKKVLKSQKIKNGLSKKIERSSKRAVKNSTGNLVKKNKRASKPIYKEEVSGLHYTKKLPLALAQSSDIARSYFQERSER